MPGVVYLLTLPAFLRVMKQPPQIFNFDDLAVKRQFMAHVGTLRGLYEVTLKPRKKTRSLDQNRYYWSAFVSPFTAWLQVEWGDPSITTEQAHDEMKRAVLGVKTKVNERTGEVMELMPPSRSMDTLEFSDYLERAAEFLARVAGIVVLPAEMFYEKQ